ncbi:COMM domain-containing protein 1-like [Clytia hemisphaerica]|uniref:COMM domain-containing protein 1 n=1 Tax=Clytia hemisphaerica TaxID=252671 RepID=A0A7M5TQ84_9CNID|eukprot:TCONS_00051476-protein
MGEKSVFGLLNGLAKRLYYGENNITDEFLQTQLYPDLNQEEFNTILLKFEQILKNIAYSNMDLRQLDAFLSSQAKKKPDFLSEGDITSITKFWKQNKSKIHTELLNRNMGRRVTAVKWRIAVTSKGSEQQVDESKVVFNIETQEGVSDTEFVRFEANETELDSMVNEIENIEKRIVNFVQH